MMRNPSKTDISRAANMIIELHGPAAADHAEMRAIASVEQGAQEEARTWRAIAEAINVMDRAAVPDDAWYIEWVAGDGTLQWGGFVVGFESARAQFATMKREMDGERQGRVRVVSARAATDSQTAIFNEALGFGTEPLLGYEAAYLGMFTAWKKGEGFRTSDSE